MPLTIDRKGWREKPPISYQLNWGSRLVHGLSGAWLFRPGGRPYDLCKNSPGNFIGNATIKDVDGYTALYVNGSGDYVQIPHTSALAVPNNKLTFAVLTKNDAAPSNFDFICGKMVDSSWTDGFGFYYGGATTVKFFNKNYAFNASATIDPLQWNLLVGTFDGTTLSIYNNGLLIGTGTPGLASANNTADLLIGCGLPQGTYRIRGGVQFCYFWNRDLSAQEVLEFSLSPYALIDTGVSKFLKTYSPPPFVSGVPTDLGCSLWLKGDYTQYEDSLGTNPAEDFDTILLSPDVSGLGNNCTPDDSTKALHANVTDGEIVLNGYTKRWMNTPAIPVNNQDFAIFFSGYLNDNNYNAPVVSGQIRQYFFSTLSGELSLFMVNHGALSIPDTLGFYDGANIRKGSLRGRSNMAVFYVVSRGDKVIIGINEESEEYAAAPAGTSTLGYLFHRNPDTDGLGANGSWKDIVFFPRGLADGEITQMLNFCKTRGVHYKSESAINVATYGDSQTQQGLFDASDPNGLNKGWGKQAGLTAYNWVNNALVGDRMENFAANRASQIDPYLDGGKQNFFGLKGGTNDIVDGSKTATDVFNYTKSCIDGAISAGWSTGTNRIIVFGILPRPDLAPDSKRQDVHNMMKAIFYRRTDKTDSNQVYAAFDPTYRNVFYIAMPENTTMGQAFQYDGVGFSADRVHESLAGHAIEGANFAAAMVAVPVNSNLLFLRRRAA